MGIDPLSVFPKEISLHVLSFLDEQMLVRCCQVGKKWNFLACDNSIWESKVNMLCNQLPHAILEMHRQKIFNEKNKKHLFAQLPKMLLSNEEILNRIQRFIDKVSLGQNGTFRCFIPFMEERFQSIKVHIRSKAVDAQQMEVREDCFTYTLAEGFVGHYASPEYQAKSVERTKLKYGYRFIKVEGWGIPYEVDNRIMTYISHANYFNNYRPYKISLIFPVFPNTNYNLRTIMEYALENMIKLKLDQLETESFYQKTRAVAQTITSIPHSLSTALTNTFNNNKKCVRYKGKITIHRRTLSH